MTEGPQSGPGDDRADAIVQDVPDRDEAGKHTGMRITIGIDTQLAAPAVAAELAAGDAGPRHELRPAPDAAYAIDADRS